MQHIISLYVDRLLGHRYVYYNYIILLWRFHYRFIVGTRTRNKPNINGIKEENNYKRSD